MTLKVTNAKPQTFVLQIEGNESDFSMLLKDLNDQDDANGLYTSSLTLRNAIKDLNITPWRY